MVFLNGNRIRFTYVILFVVVVVVVGFDTIRN